ncbi:MAG: hypothetical protein U9Q17_02305 [Chloroflexota bacterium]|nr:hypothetical protein [Chloroflexota bacterium]
MKAQNVRLRSSCFDLVGQLYIPRTSGTTPALCICHGIPATPYNPSNRGYAELAQRFCRAGFATLIFNFRGAGKSQGNLDILGWCHDLEAAIDFLYNLKEVVLDWLELQISTSIR